MNKWFIEIQNKNDTSQETSVNKFLTFLLGRQEYTIEMQKVREIVGLMPIAPVPQMPGYVRGVLNLRGKIVPVLSLRSCLGLADIEDTDETCVIVIREASQLIGILVDQIVGVTNISNEQIEMMRFFGVNHQKRYLKGKSKVENSEKWILDVHRVFYDVPKNLLYNYVS